jgi:hypothetical protein
MRMSTFTGAIALMTLTYAAGCTQPAATPPAKESAAKTDQHDHDEHSSSEKVAGTKKAEHDHSGWWCGEHGVPEGICSQCSSKVAAELQKKGDWCAEHDRAKSQCFLCDPSLKEKFAAQYRAKEGKEPPAIEAEPDTKADKKS